MSQASEGDGAQGTLGKKNLTTMHAVAQALAIGPMFSVALILGGVSRPDIGAGWNATLAVLLAGIGGCVGVFAAEVRNGREQDPSTRAVAVMIAAQLAGIIPAWPAGSTSACADVQDSGPMAASGGA